MIYTCENCGVAADDPSSLCKPTSEEQESKFCGAPATQVCVDKRSTMRYTCDSCGSVSADAGHLCNPREV